MTKIQSSIQNICAALIYTVINQGAVKNDEVAEMNLAVKEITNNVSMLTLGENMRDGMLPAIEENNLIDNAMLSMTLLIRTLNQTGFNTREGDILDGIEASTNELRNGIDIALGKNAFKKMVLAAVSK